MLCVQPNTRLEAVIDQVIQSGLLPRLSEIIKTVGFVDLTYNTLWCFINVCCGNSDQVEKALEAGLLPLVFQIIDQAIEGKEEVLGLASEGVWLIGNISGDSIQHRDALLDQEGGDKIVALVKKYPNNEKILDNGVWALQNLVSKKPAPFWNQVSDAFKLFLEVLTTDASVEVKYHALWGICYLSGSYTVNIVDSGCIPLMVKYIGNEENRLVFPALQVLGNVISSTRDNFTDEVLKQPDLLPLLFKLCENTNDKIKIYTTWTISNIAAGTPQQISQIIDNPQYIQKLSERLKESDEKVRCQASCALSNLVFRATVDQIEQLITKHEYLELLLQIMKEADLSLYEINLITAIEKIVESDRTRKLSQMLKDKGIVTQLQEISGNLSYEMRALANELIRTRLTGPITVTAPVVNTTATTAATATTATTAAPSTSKTTPKKSQPKVEAQKAERPKEAKKIRKAPKSPAKKKATIRRTKTMQDTINEGKIIAKGIKRGGRTRQDSKPASVKKSTPKSTPTKAAKAKEDDKGKGNTPQKVQKKKIMKRTLSMKQTLSEAKQHIKHIDARKKSAKKN